MRHSCEVFHNDFIMLIVLLLYTLLDFENRKYQIYYMILKSEDNQLAVSRQRIKITEGNNQVYSLPN